MLTKLMGRKRTKFAVASFLSLFVVAGSVFGLNSFVDSVSADALPDGSDAVFVSVSTIPASVTTNHAVENIYVTMRNTGSAAWTNEGGYALSATSDYGRIWSGITTAYLSLHETVQPGQSKTFTIERLVSPSEIGTWHFAWQMTKNKTVFGVSTPDSAITVVGNAAKMVGLSNFPLNNAVVAGQPLPNIAITFRNTGTTTWNKATGYSLFTPHDYFWGFRNVALSDTDSIPPGDTKTFTFSTLYTPKERGWKEMWLQMIQSVKDGNVFGDMFAGRMSITDTGLVPGAIDDAQVLWVQNLPSASDMDGHVHHILVKMRNTGNTTWKKSDGYGISAIAKDPTDQGNNMAKGNGFMEAGKPIAPGEEETFEVDAWVNTPDLYHVRYQMNRDGGDPAMFGEITPDATINFVMDNAAITLKGTNFSDASVNQAVDGLSFIAKNTGTSTWTANDEYHIIYAFNCHNGTAVTQSLGAYVELPIGRSVEPGGSIELALPSRKAPAKPGYCVVQVAALRGEFLTPPIHGKWVGQPSDFQFNVLDDNNAGFVEQGGLSPQMKSSDKADVHVTMRNTGKTTWTKAAGYKLSTNPGIGASLTDKWGVTRVELSDTDSIQPGQTKTFAFSITAPFPMHAYDIFSFGWQLVKETATDSLYFGEGSADFRPRVYASDTIAHDDATFVSVGDIPAKVGMGSMITTTVTVMNTGNTTWTQAAGNSLCLYTLVYCTAGSLTELDPGDSIQPGQTKTFNVKYQLPLSSIGDLSKLGEHYLQWQMVGGVSGMHGDLSKAYKFEQVANDAEFVGVNGLPKYMVRGQSVTAQITFKNTSQVAWKGGESVFLHCKDSVNINYLTLKPDDTIPPGGTKTFEVRFGAPWNQTQLPWQWFMTDGHGQAFGQTSPDYVVTIVDDLATPQANGPHALPSTTVTDQSISNVTVDMVNTGKTTWTKAAGYSLGLSEDPSLRFDLADTDAILPGQKKSFVFAMTMPHLPGQYQFHWRMTHTGNTDIGAFGDTASQQTTVKQAPTTTTTGTSISTSSPVPTVIATPTTSTPTLTPTLTSSTISSSNVTPTPSASIATTTAVVPAPIFTAPVIPPPTPTVVPLPAPSLVEQVVNAITSIFVPTPPVVTTPPIPTATVTATPSNSPTISSAPTTPATTASSTPVPALTQTQTQPVATQSPQASPSPIATHSPIAIQAQIATVDPTILLNTATTRAGALSAFNALKAAAAKKRSTNQLNAATQRQINLSAAKSPRDRINATVRYRVTLLAVQRVYNSDIAKATSLYNAKVKKLKK